ncbi:hypothetical protein [Pedobacter cryophilus]|uniref:Uncharacterized protein n=1 Tax=Pedobacter cryophilus TaxID=2571271 RepID=A0A4V5P119_9SPHI|nr:hypothetical protein [Pedobacter cryophilus]TKC00571.1 hypothetical protein FA046_02525 [Pedobacter cryophilus]
MMVTLKKYSVSLFVLLIFSACRQNFEWVNINPDKLISASKSTPYQKGVRQVDLTLDLKEKEKRVYFESPEAYISAQPTAPVEVVKPKVTVKKSGKKKSDAPIKTTPVKALQPEVKVEKEKPVVKAKEVQDTSADKLNGALKIPVKDKKVIKEPAKKKVLAEPIANKTTEKPTNQVVSKDSSPSFQREPIIEDSSSTKSFEPMTNAKRGNNFLLAGLVLGVMGVILGLIFGKMAYLISIAGIIFALIGFLMKL